MSRVGTPVPGGGRSPCRATIRATLSAASSDAIDGCVTLGWGSDRQARSAAGGGLNGQALRVLAQPRHWEADAT